MTSRPRTDPSLRWFSRDVVVVSLLTVLTQALIAASQFVFAALFGASLESDAFFAALAAPTYVTSVVTATVVVVFIPIYVDLRNNQSKTDAEALARGAINTVTLILAAIALTGIFASDLIIGWTAPGLPAEGRELAHELAGILWPSVVGSGLIVLLTALWQVDAHFGWPAFVPVIGAIVNLLVIVALSQTIGVVGAAIAWTLGFAVQALLLISAIAPSWRPSLELDHPGMRALFAGVAPLALAAIFIRASTLLERYLGSELPTGQLSQLTYASRIVAILGVFVSAGPAAVLLPRMAEDVSALDFGGLRARVSSGLRMSWLVVAPLLALLIALADPLVRLAFEHGAFTRTDANAVALLIRVYAPAVFAVGFAAITGRAIYALKAVRVLAVVGAVEGAAYIAYTTFLAHALGVVGIALGFSIYFVGSATWQLVYLRARLDAHGRALASSFFVTTAAALIAGGAAWLANGLFDAPLLAIVAGTSVGLVCYLGIVTLARLDGRGSR